MENNILQDEFRRLKAYYNDLSWFTRLFFPAEIASLLDNEEPTTGLYQYKLIKHNSSNFSRWLFSGIVRYFNNIQHTERTIEFLDQHDLIDYYVGELQDHTALVIEKDFQKAYESVISKNVTDKDTTKAAALLAALKDSHKNNDVEFRRQIRAIAESLALHTTDEGILNIEIEPLFEILSQISDNEGQFAPVVTSLLKAGLLDGEQWQHNLDFLTGDTQLIGDIDRLLSWLLDSNQLALLTQARFDKIFSYADPENNFSDVGDIENIIFLLTNQYEVSSDSDGRIIYKVENNGENLFSATVFDTMLTLSGKALASLKNILEFFSKTALFNQENLQSILDTFLINDSENEGGSYLHCFQAVYESGLFDNDKAQDNFDKLNNYHKEEEFSMISLSSLGTLSQSDFEYYMKQTPADRNAQYEKQSRKLANQIFSGASSHTLFSAGSSSAPKGKGKRKNPSVVEGSIRTRHRQRREAIPAQRVNQRDFYFEKPSSNLPPTCITNPTPKFS